MAQTMDRYDRDLSMSSLTNLLYLDSDTRKQNIIDYWHKMYLF